MGVLDYLWRREEFLLLDFEPQPLVPSTSSSIVSPSSCPSDTSSSMSLDVLPRSSLSAPRRGPRQDRQLQPMTPPDHLTTAASRINRPSDEAPTSSAVLYGADLLRHHQAVNDLHHAPPTLDHQPLPPYYFLHPAATAAQQIHAPVFNYPSSHFTHATTIVELPAFVLPTDISTYAREHSAAAPGGGEMPPDREQSVSSSTGAASARRRGKKKAGASGGDADDDEDDPETRKRAPKKTENACLFCRGAYLPSFVCCAPQS